MCQTELRYVQKLRRETWQRHRKWLKRDLYVWHQRRQRDNTLYPIHVSLALHSMKYNTSLYRKNKVYIVKNTCITKYDQLMGIV